MKKSQKNLASQTRQVSQKRQDLLLFCACSANYSDTSGDCHWPISDFTRENADWKLLKFNCPRGEKSSFLSLASRRLIAQRRDGSHRVFFGRPYRSDSLSIDNSDFEEPHRNCTGSIVEDAITVQEHRH